MDQELTPDKTDKLVQFQELSGIEDISTCVEILERHLWDVETAIHDHLGLDPREQFAGNYATHTSGLDENMQEAVGRSRNEIQRSSVDSVVQRILTFFFNPFLNDNVGLWPLSSNRPDGFTGWIIFLSSLPLRIAMVTFYQITSYVVRLIRPDHHQAFTDPTQNVISFIQEYDSTYGANHPTFYVGTYNQVLGEAKKNLKFLLVYLYCKDHQDTNRFCRQTLSNFDVIQYINDNCLMWGCSVDSLEGYRVSQSLRENTYPFIAVVVQRQNRMTVVGRIEGFVDPSVFLQRLRDVIADNEASLVVARADREERSFTQALRQEQDQAYLESLRADQEKEERKRREKLLEEERLRELQEQEQAKQKKQDELLKRKLDAILLVPPEPNPEESGCCRILVRLPSGQKLERRFHRHNHTLKDLYYFILAHPDSPFQFEMATSFPKRTLSWQSDLESYPTLSEVGFGASEALLVLDLDA